MNDKQWLESLFEAIDSRDSMRFSQFMAVDGIFRFGNLPAIQGREVVEGFVRNFFDSIRSVSHTILDRRRTPDGVICHGMVSYTRQGGSVLTVPFPDVLRGD